MKYKLIKTGLKNITVYMHSGVSTGDVIDLAPEFAIDAATKEKVWEVVAVVKKAPAKKAAKKRAVKK